MNQPQFYCLNSSSPFQAQFRANRSTISASVDYLEYITSALNSKNCVLSISLDLSKAFDSLPHNILMEKTETFGIRGLAHTWLKSYLSNRTQKVTINNNKTVSDIRYSTHGVPQGSILGPTLFLL